MAKDKEETPAAQTPVPMSGLAATLGNYIRAANTALWVETPEQEVALQEITTLCTRNGWALMVWNPADGLYAMQTSVPLNITASKEPIPNAALMELDKVSKQRTESRKDNSLPPSTILVLQNPHDMISASPLTRQMILRSASLGHKNRGFVVVLSPVLRIPIELERLFTVVTHDLPSRDQLATIAKTLAVNEGEYPTDTEEERRVLEAAQGMSHVEAENAFSLSLITTGTIDLPTVWAEKSRSLLRGGLLQLSQDRTMFSDLGGMEHMKSFHKQLLERRHANPLAQPRGTLLLSPPGCGKSAFCKALGNEVGRPVVTLNIGALMGSLVGQTEAQTRSALRTVDAMAPCILFIDEVEKGLSGVNSRGTTDNGVSSRLFGTLLTWLNDHTSDVFVVATSNDIAALPPEFSRAERFDGLFFLDIPNDQEKKSIWDIYLKKFELRASGKTVELPDDKDWTGAEIRSCCRLAAMLGVSLRDASRLVVPIMKTSGDTVGSLREWAVGKCLDASIAGIYGDKGGSFGGGGKRSITRAAAAAKA